MSDGKNPAKNALHLFSDFNCNNVRYCHWKSNQHLEAGLVGDTDLDILIDPSNADLAQQLMVQNNYKRVISHEWKLYSSVEDWIGLDAEQMLQTHLHVHYRLLTGLKNVKDQYFDYNEIVLNNALMQDQYQIMICNPAIEIIFLIMRAALKKSSLLGIRSVFGENERNELAYLQERTTENEVSEFACQMLPDDMAKQLILILKNPNSVSEFKKFRKALFCNLSMLQRSTRFRAECTFIWRSIVYKASKLLKRPIRLKKKSSTGGKLISFIGVDGAGKTTLATFYAKWLSWKIDCEYVYLGTGDGKTGVLNRLKKKLVNSKSSGKHSSAGIDNNEIRKSEKPLSFRQRIKRTLSNIVRLSNDKYKYKTIKKIYKSVNAGKIIITDRYPQMVYSGIYDGMTIRPLTGRGFLARLNEHYADKEKKLYEKMCRFTPNIVIKLIIPVEVSCTRKPCSGNELENVKRKVQITDVLHYSDSKEFLIDSSKDLDFTKKEIVSLLWRHI